MRVLAVVLGVLTMVAGINAQTEYGTIRVTVRDARKAVLPGVQVTLANPGRKIIYTAPTNEGGQYRFDLPAGVYDLTAELCGFQPLNVPKIQLRTGVTIQQEVQLTAGGKVDCVIVRGSTPISTIR